MTTQLDTDVKLVAKALRRFPWHNFGLDEVAEADPEWEWTEFAATAILAVLDKAGRLAKVVSDVD